MKFISMHDGNIHINTHCIYCGLVPMHEFRKFLLLVHLCRSLCRSLCRFSLSVALPIRRTDSVFITGGGRKNDVLPTLPVLCCRFLRDTPQISH